jgi:hypothetical protein
MQGLLNGVPAIHLNVDTSLSADPMMTLKACKWTARTPKGLSKALQEVQSLTSPERSNLIEEAMVYNKAYLTTPDEEKMMPF